MTLTGQGPQTSDPIGPIADGYTYEDAPKVLPLPFAASPFPPTPVDPPDPHPFQTLAATLADPEVARDRDAVFQALQDRDVAAPLDPSVSILAAYAEDVLLAPPMIQPLGFDLAPAPAAGRVVSLADARPSAAPPLIVEPECEHEPLDMAIDCVIADAGLHDPLGQAVDLSVDVDALRRGRRCGHERDDDEDDESNDGH